MKQYVSPVGKTKWHHDPENCFYVNEPEKYVERDERYVEYHELEPCPDCHPDMERRTYVDQGPSMAKQLRYGD